MKPEALIEFRKNAEELEIVGSGAWTAANAGRLDALIGAESRHDRSRVKVDMSGVREFDTYGAWFLERLLRDTEEIESQPAFGLPDRFRGLFEKVHETNRRRPSKRKGGKGLIGGLEGVGRSVEGAANETLRYLDVVGAVVIDCIDVILVRRRPRLASFTHQLDRVGVKSVPIIVLLTLLIGAIIAQQAVFYFRRFGAEDYVVDLVGVLVLRELGVLIVAILVAGRCGSSYTAELGSMKMNEEIDALRTMGRGPIEVLVLPRVAALVFALPLLTFIGSIAALYGGGAVAWLYAGMEPGFFIARLREAVSISDFAVGMIKSPFMALVIGIIACAEGLKVKGSAESLGAQTTASVVKSIFSVIVMDGVFAIFFSSIGM
ncbi:MAG: MlaE family lipid ABC transporter permease subunit [Hyphomicrobiales bacterium]|nr:MlaE family lipid ABC transporter permease subunit [Hyphomicrobiales bacterium]